MFFHKDLQWSYFTVFTLRKEEKIMKIHERMSEKRCFYMIAFLAVILFVLSGCEKQQPESESADSIPTINIGISARTGLSKNLSEVNQTLGDLTEEKIGVRARLVWTGLNSSQGNSYYKNRQLGVDILNIYFNQFENYRQKNLLLDMEPYMAEALALQEVLDEKTDLPDEIGIRAYDYENSIAYEPVMLQMS